MTSHNLKCDAGGRRKRQIEWSVTFSQQLASSLVLAPAKAKGGGGGYGVTDRRRRNRCGLVETLVTLTD